jgi:hypothetical protein
MKKRNVFRTVLVFGVPVLMLILLLALVLPAAANPKDSWSQCANGLPPDTECNGQGSTGWVSGKIGKNNGDYTIGDFIAYRAYRTGLVVGYRYCSGAHWDVAKADLPALDYIGSYNHTVTDADALLGTDVPTDTVPVTADIPADPVLMGGYYLGTITGTFTGTLPYGNVGDAGAQGVMTVWGGTDINIKGYALTPTVSSVNLANRSQSVEVCFEATATDVVMAWGGHIAKPFEWSAPDRPPGSPYHMKTGTSDDVNGIPWFTAPRTSVNDLAEYLPGDPGCSDTSDCPTANHYTVGSQDLQLGIDEPTAITLKSVSAGDSSDGLTLALIGVGVAALLSAIFILIRRQRFEMR